ALKDGQDGGDGVYNAGASGFPASSFQSSNYWVDVVFNRAPPDTTPPNVSSVSPAAGATGASTAASISGQFNEAIDPASVTSTSFDLRGPGGSAVAAQLSASGSTATLNPNAALAPSTTYTATLHGGASGVKDQAGNPLSADYVWSFTTAAAGACPCTPCATARTAPTASTTPAPAASRPPPTAPVTTGWTWRSAARPTRRRRRSPPAARAPARAASRPGRT